MDVYFAWEFSENNNKKIPSCFTSDCFPLICMLHIFSTDMTMSGFNNSKPSFPFCATLHCYLLGAEWRYDSCAFYSSKALAYKITVLRCFFTIVLICEQSNA